MKLKKVHCRNRGGAPFLFANVLSVERSPAVSPFCMGPKKLCLCFQGLLPAGLQ
ncbi:hypothetical protein B4099_2127 [Heyndrickxia coagulans]|uniref:Uncharacterized protein n=1 Tax=Heyndrickxia coagulans TaxID=1398 RepID=A0A150KDI3_HEYCO|nr:hypothetical protein B4099_2127 [Heyndrickxia coagulans]